MSRRRRTGIILLYYQKKWSDLKTMSIVEVEKKEREEN